MDPFYHLAHRALRSRLLQDTGFFEAMLADQAKARAWIDEAAAQTVKLCGLKPELAKALSDYCTIYKGKIAGQPAVIVELPPPQVASQCYFVAAFRSGDGELRYYTLERSFGEDQVALCGWSGGTHSLYEFIPAGQDAAAFGAAIETIEQRRAPLELDLPPLD